MKRDEGMLVRARRRWVSRSPVGIGRLVGGRVGDSRKKEEIINDKLIILISSIIPYSFRRFVKILGLHHINIAYVESVRK